MSDNSKIHWTDATWNPVVGCSKVSPGCANCYAEKKAYRLMCMGKEGYTDVVERAQPRPGRLTGEPCWSGKIAVRKSVMDQPLLGPVVTWPWILSYRFATTIDHVIVGGESGPSARPCALNWIRAIIRQCKDANVPVFIKQLGTAWEHSVYGYRGKGDNIEDWPADLRVREEASHEW